MIQVVMVVHISKIYLKIIQEVSGEIINTIHQKNYLRIEIGELDGFPNILMDGASELVV